GTIAIADVGCDVCLSFLCFFFLLLRRPSSSPLFPYTTLFRSWGVGPKSAARLHLLGLRTIGQLVETGEDRLAAALGEGSARAGRSEEHTSELQSRFDLVCRLLLEKKNKNDSISTIRYWIRTRS